MYKIEKKFYGYRLTFQGFILRKEMNAWYEDSVKSLKDAPESYGLLADLRKMKTLPAESQDILEKGQRLYIGKGLVRSAVITEESIIAVQFKRISQNNEPGFYEEKRFLNATSDPNWEEHALAWIVEAKEPPES